MTMMTDDALKAAQALADAATAGSWEVKEFDGRNSDYKRLYVYPVGGAESVCFMGQTWASNVAEDAAFIAASRSLVPSLLAHVAAQAAELAALRAVAQAVVDNGWYRGDYNGGGTCEWCAYGQEPHWKNLPERHAPDCTFVAARNLVQPASDGALPPIADWQNHG